MLQSRLNGNTLAVDAEQRELLETYAEVINFLLRTYATDEVIAEAVGDVTSFRQSSSMTEEVYSNHLWDKALRCDTVYSDRRLKSLFVEGLLPATCAQVRNYLATNPQFDYQAVARYAQAIGETHRASRRQGLPPMAPREPTDPARRNARTARGRSVLSVESSSDLPMVEGTSAEEVLAVTGQRRTRTARRRRAITRYRHRRLGTPGRSPTPRPARERNHTVVQGRVPVFALRVQD